MFAPDHARTAAELLRVARRGGRIGLANWTPEGFIGELFRTVGRHLPPPAGVRSPALWGTEARIVELFGRTSRRHPLRAPQLHLPLPLAPSTGSTCSAPTTDRRMSRSMRFPRTERGALAADITAMLERRNVGGRDSLVVPGEYLEVVVTRA